jgi:PKD repeat protein
VNPVQFNDISSIAYGNIASWHWNFGDGSPVNTNQNPLHSFPASGTYVVTLWVYSVTGCVDSVSYNITIDIPPVAGFSSTVACAGSPTVFSNTSSSVSSPITNWLWDFGDQATDTSQNPQHIYSAPGNYTVTLLAVTAAGCPDTIIQSVTVLPSPVVSVAASSINLCIGQSTTLSASGANSYAWSPSNSLSSAAGNSVIATPASTTVYTITGTGSNGCTGTSQVTVVVNMPPALATSPDVSICKGDTTLLTASGAASYSWSPAIWLNTTTGDSVICVPFFTTTYFVTATTNGCTSTASITVTVNPTLIVPPLTQISDTLFCTTGYVTYQWYFNTFLIPGATNYYYVVIQTGSYYVEVTDTNGCRGNSGLYVLLTGTHENFAANRTVLYPNPFSTAATLILNTEKFYPELRMTVYDTPGRMVAAENIYPEIISGGTRETKTTIHRNELSAGIYFYKLSAGRDVIAEGKMMVNYTGR